MSEATFYAWKKKYAHSGMSELCRLRHLAAAPFNISRGSET